jgi:hypothetical protein
MSVIELLMSKGNRLTIVVERGYAYTELPVSTLRETLINSVRRSSMTTPKAL